MLQSITFPKHCYSWESISGPIGRGYCEARSLNM